MLLHTAMLIEVWTDAPIAPLDDLTVIVMLMTTTMIWNEIY
jgi:hypothetical protein